MKASRFLLAGTVFFSAACSVHPHPVKTFPTVARSSTWSGGDGSSLEEAISFPLARSSADGVPMEWRWISERYPEFRKTAHAIVEEDSRLYDVLEISTPGGETRTFWFDVTTWFGIGRPVADSPGTGPF